MMGALDTLRAQLKQTTDLAFRGMDFDQKPMAQELKRLQTWLGSTGSIKPARNQMIEALRRFHQTKTLPNLRETRLVCHACIETFGEKRYRLIDDLELFSLLLQIAHQYREKPRQLRRCYRALLHAYFVYDVDADDSSNSDKRNWSELRTHLRGWVDRLAGEGVLPDWVRTITEHPNLLNNDPCARYGLSMLEGRRDEFEHVQRELAIPDTSWLVRRLVLEQVKAAIDLGDERFRSHIPSVLTLLREHQTVLPKGLALVLGRYSTCSAVTIHPELRDFAVQQWGNPWLKRNSARWGLVSDEVKAMVTEWLKLDLMRRFFGLLTEDGATDTRRLKFWERYLASIDDMYFALGPSARGNLSPDFRELRQKMHGRQVQLFAAGPAETNAFIMCIGEHVVVEFGKHGNACFIFHRDRLPFDLSSREIAGNREQLKHDSNLERLLHIDRQDATWEEHFEASLASLLKVKPSDRDTVGAYATGSLDQSQPSITGSRQGPPLHTSEPRRAGPAPFQYSAWTPEPFSRREFERFCTVRSLRVVDHTDRGGNLRVETSDKDESVSNQLTAWGFQYKEGRGWWRKEG